MVERGGTFGSSFSFLQISFTGRLRLLRISATHLSLPRRNPKSIFQSKPTRNETRLVIL
ncbi:hypothetical protein Hanom_Chr05g00444931 [Helianthus anomalus]